MAKSAFKSSKNGSKYAKLVYTHLYSSSIYRYRYVSRSLLAAALRDIASHAEGGEHIHPGRLLLPRRRAAVDARTFSDGIYLSLTQWTLESKAERSCD